MREGRRRPSLQVGAAVDESIRTGRNEGGAPAPLVGKAMGVTSIPEFAAMREGRRRPSLAVSVGYVVPGLVPQ